MEPTIVIYGATPGTGGLGLQAATALHSIASLGSPVCGLGPRNESWPFPEAPSNVTWLTETPNVRTARVFKGRAQYRTDCEFGEKLAKHVRTYSPRRCYGFTQISLEVAEWCKANGVPFILDNPNGHIRNVRTVYQRESWRWCSTPYLGHPTESMVERVEKEYSLAAQIRVSSNFAKETMVRRGVPREKIHVIPQFLNIDRFRQPESVAPARTDGPLRVCFVGSLDLRKGFVYLLRAIRKVGSQHFTVRFVGNTGDPWCRRLFAREARGLSVELLPGDPVPVYHWAEVAVTPSLEDGFGFVVAEAMASGTPVIVSDQCGAAEWVEPDISGWVVPSRSEPSLDWHVHVRQEDLLAQYLQLALDNRARLADMGRAALYSVIRCSEKSKSELAQWFYFNTLVAP